MSTLKATAARDKARVRKATRNPWLEQATRLGYVVRGLLYGSIGVLALTGLVGAGGPYTDQQGGLRLLAGGALGRAILVVLLLGLVAYSLWGFIRALLDPLHRGDKPPAIAERLGFAWSGLCYAALFWFGLQLLFGAGGATGDSNQKAAQWLLQHPGGGLVATVAGVIGVVAGLVQFYQAYTADFQKYLRRGQMSRAQRLGTQWLGRFGMFSRGVIFTMSGCFMVVAAVAGDASQAHGTGGSLARLAGEPVGRVLLPAVAVGLVALGLHSVASARWGRLERC